MDHWQSLAVKRSIISDGDGLGKAREAAASPSSPCGAGTGGAKGGVLCVCV